MISLNALRKLREGRIREHMSHGTDMDGYRRGSLAFARELHESLGVGIDDFGRPYIPKDERGWPLRPAAGCINPAEIGLRHLAESILGHDRVEQYLHPSGGNGFSFAGRALMEAAIDPALFTDISLLNIATFGLVNAKIIERFNAPDYIGRGMVEIVPVSSNGYKRIGVSKVIPPDKTSRGRQPGEQHTEVGLGEAYQQAAATSEQAEKIVVTKEAYYFDFSGQLMESAGEVGDDLMYGMERDIASTVLGVTGLASRYNLNGTTYETYQASSPFINTQSNALASGSFDATSVDKARQLFVGMTDPITGREIKVIGRDILVAPGSELLMMSQLYGTTIQIGSQLNSNFPSWWQEAQNYLPQLGKNMGQAGPYRVIPMTSIWYNLMTAGSSPANGYPGLNLTATNAKKTWYVGDFPRAFTWTENWPLTTWEAPADELIMKDRGIVAVFGANYRGSAWVREPRFVVQSTQ